LTFLAVCPAIYDQASPPGFYVKGQADDKWCLVVSHFREMGNYLPDGVMVYEQMIYYDAPGYESLSRAFKGKYKEGRLLVLIYKEGNRMIFDVFDVKTRQVIY